MFKLRVALLWLSPSSETRKKTPKKMSARDPGTRSAQKDLARPYFLGIFTRVSLNKLREKAPTLYVTTMLRVDFVEGLELLDSNPKVPGSRCISA